MDSSRAVSLITVGRHSNATKRTWSGLTLELLVNVVLVWVCGWAEREETWAAEVDDLVLSGGGPQAFYWMARVSEPWSGPQEIVGRRGKNMIKARGWMKGGPEFK